MAGDALRYTVFMPNGTSVEGSAPVTGSTWLTAKAVVLSILRKERQAADLEHVVVLFQDKRHDMFVDEMGAVVGLPVNEAATQIYWNATKAKSGSKIHGPAILFHSIVWE